MTSSSRTPVSSDGTGAPARSADVAVLNGRIARSARFRRSWAARTSTPPASSSRPVSSMCTRTPTMWRTSRSPKTSSTWASRRSSPATAGTSALSIGDAFDRIQSTTVAINFGTFIGHNTVRQAVMGTIARDPNIIEFKAMQVLVFKGMAEGAVGFSTGLQYVPGTYAKPNELIELARIAANEGGIYATHMRNEGTQIEASVTESIRLARRLDMPLEISHLKIDSPSRWGSSAMS
jgi:N-acyl-D-aspartate/D-glutamate deacylase